MTHDGSFDDALTDTDVLLDQQDGEWVFLPRSDAGRAALTELIIGLGADPTSPPVERGVEVSPEAANVLGSLLQKSGVRVGALCEECRAALQRVM